MFKINNNKKYYYTGDKAEIRDDQWFINGRIDFQIKLNGYRMELEEIEFQLGQIACIKEAIVVPIYKGNKVIHLNAVIVVNEADRVENEQEAIHNIKYELKQRIPEYMIPRKVIFQDKLPLTVNGKLDRKKIAEDVM